MKILKGILLTLFYCLPVFSQQTTDWKVLTSMANVQSTAFSSTGVWGATTGGAFFYETASGIYKKLTKAEGLTGIFLTSAAVDKNGKVWLGSLSGSIDVYDPATDILHSVLDIYNSDKTLKNINELRASGDTVYVSTSYGVSLIDINTMVPLDTYFKFGSLTSNQQVNSTFRADVMYVCTENGISVQKAGAGNLSSPDAWNIYTTADGLPSNSVIKAAEYKGVIYALTSGGLAEFTGSSWVSPQSEPLKNLNGNFLDITTQDEALFLLTSNTVYKIEEQSVSSATGLTGLRKFSVAPGAVIYAASSRGIQAVKNDMQTSTIIPNGPPANQFPALAVDNDGSLWSASGKDGKGAGFYKYNGSEWTTYSVSNNPGLFTNDFYSAYSSPDNIQYLGTWGAGFVRVKNGNISVFTAANTGMAGIDVNPNFLVITGFANDSKNNLWVLNYWATDHRTLSMLSPDSTWRHFSVPSDNVSIEHHYSLVIDQYDTKWYTIQNQGKSGLVYFNENKTIDNTGDDRSGFLTTGSGLNNNIIKSVVIDKRGDVWVGTPTGVNVISNTNTITGSSTPQLRISSVYSLRQQSVTCMAVDPLNQKWIGTNEGLLLVNTDGSSVLANYTNRNSALLSNDIKSISIDEKSGTIYVGTDEGLTSFKTLGIKPNDSFTELFIYPSPVVLNKGNNLVTIDGLIKESEVKILSVSGKLVRVIPTSEVSPGGYRAQWDAKDDDGNLVNSGIYIIVAYDAEGTNVATGKIAILRE